MGLAAGFALAGRIPVVYMQNDGYGNAVNPLSSLQLMYKLPALMLISWRAEPGKKDAAQHQIMGDTIRQLLELFDIPFIVPERENINKAIIEARNYIQKQSKPFALIFKKGFFESYKTKGYDQNNNLKIRLDYLNVLKISVKQDDILLGSTGFSGRELYQTFENKGKFYMMGSMGCLPAIGLGLAIEKPDKRIFLIDGDGALLMKMGSLSTVGHYSPNNLIHICFDNQNYESTGGQPTTSPSTDFAAIASACGYKTVNLITDLNNFEAIIAKIDTMEKPCFLHIKVKSGSLDQLTRPSNTPEQMKDELMRFLNMDYS
ncbi:phosphonopyruvate decarboxylase [candidate division KSB1 bacterium]|nr:phosphonopyruvate decarboxylase [candidate division KSB1 bacterium]